MTEVNKAGSINYNMSFHKTSPKKETKEKVDIPKDEVTLGKPKKSLAEKIIEFPGKVIGTAIGVATGAVSAPLHVIPGAVKGMKEGVAEYKGEGTKASFSLTLWAQNLALGAGAGFMIGGPIGAFIGGAGSLIFTGFLSYMGEKTDAYDNMISTVERDVDKAVADNEGSKMKVAVQNLTEGAIIGGGSAAKVGWKVGYETGKGVTEGVFGAVEGLAEGIYGAGKSIIEDIKK